MDRLPMESTIAELRAGTYVLEESVETEVKALRAQIQAAPDIVSQSEVRTVLYSDTAKTFRNAVSALVMEAAWPHYSESVAGDQPGIFDIAVDKGISSLVPINTDTFAEMPLTEVARLIARSNQSTPSHFICQQFVGGRIPEFSGHRETDMYYMNLLEDQAELLLLLDSQFRTLPSSVGAPSVFIASGTVVVRTQIFGLPNVMDALAANSGFSLTNEQHRKGFDNTMRKGVASYYLPVSDISVGVNDHIVDHENFELLPDKWKHNNDPDNFFVYPDPLIVSRVNNVVQSRKQGEGIAGQTSCPVFHSHVPLNPNADRVVRVPRSQADLALQQLDRWYYPHRVNAAHDR